MEQQEVDNLDSEYEKHLETLNDYMTCDLVEPDVINICNKWIDKLSQCDDDEKDLRNMYIISLCNQINDGYLKDMFVDEPPTDKLPPLLEFDNELTPVASAETMVLTSNEQVFCKNDEILIIDQHQDRSDVDKSTRSAQSEHTFDTKYPLFNQELMIYNCHSLTKFHSQKNYQQRVTNVIVKLKELKQENILLHSEIRKLKSSILQDDGLCPSLEEFIHKTIDKANKSTQEILIDPDELQEMQWLKESNGRLLDSVNNLKQTLQQVQEDNLNEICDLKEQYTNHVNILKTAIQEEMKEAYEKDIDKLKTFYEAKLREMQDKISNDFRDLIFIKDNMLQTKGQLIEEKDKELSLLRLQINELQNKLFSIQSNNNDEHKKELEFYKNKAEQLEKTVAKMEKSKQKCIKSYETKLSFMQRDRHLAECSLQLQLVKQRSQVINDVTETNQHELNNSIDKLETKYKDIVANMQATAIQRRLQDQIALETILQAACGRSQNDNFQTSSGANKFVRKTVRMDNRYGNYNIANGNMRFDKTNNSSFDSDSAPGFCLRSEDLCEVFDKVFIPQKDTPDNVPVNK